MAGDATHDDLELIRAEQGFDAYVKAVAQLHGESEARRTLRHRTAAELKTLTADNRHHLDQWRSTPDGEADYQQTCLRIVRSIEDHDADGSTRAAG